jgi:hypothetical protein
VLLLFGVVTARITSDLLFSKSTELILHYLYPLYALAGLVSNLAIIIGMWRMKKWSAYLLVAYFASKILVDVIYILPDKQLTVFATTVVGAGLWFWAIYRKWELFD